MRANSRKNLEQFLFQKSSTIRFAVSPDIKPYQSPDFSIYEKGLDVISKMHYCQTQIKKMKRERVISNENLEKKT